MLSKFMLCAVLACIALFLPEAGHCAPLVMIPTNALPWVGLTVFLIFMTVFTALLEAFAPSVVFFILAVLAGGGSYFGPLLIGVQP